VEVVAPVSVDMGKAAKCAAEGEAAAQADPAWVHATEILLRAQIVRNQQQK
jgi:hypothetical protein